MDNNKQQELPMPVKESGKELIPMEAILVEILEKNYKIYLKDDAEIGITMYEVLQKAIHEAASLAYNRGVIEGRNSNG